ncbi:uncharacterized protein LOC126896834 [Daktulosphaira vitifoliae]|uniref:uncharacterized protein LOC126896834 n=1 Tax=Daktulosphaira vitifoliae TaxID=58002 RepID=UPI0021AA0E9C|nr:uncharacterized protein LOC126896834 [Daktulosphaira vitifoliae]
MLLFCHILTFLMITFDISNEHLVDHDIFWVNPCGYSKKNEEPPITPLDVIKRVLLEAHYNHHCFNQFKYEFIYELTGVEFDKHYEDWEYLYNSWMTNELPTMPGIVLSETWLNSREFPKELTFTFETLQRAAVGLEKFLDDKKNEEYYSTKLSLCRNKLKTLLCEVSDGIEDMNQNKMPDIKREVIPNDIRNEPNVAQRNLTNSLIFRDYIISIEYILQTYKYFRNSYEHK